MLTSHYCIWDVFSTCRQGCAQSKLLPSLKAPAPGREQPPTAVALLPSCPAFICLSAHKRMHTGTRSGAAKGVACLRSQSHLTEHQPEHGEAPLLIPDSAAASAPTVVGAGHRIAES